MSSSDSNKSQMLLRRDFALATSVALVASCGFQPAINNPVVGRAAPHYGQFRLPDAHDDSTFSLRQALERYLGEGTTPLFQIDVSYATSTSVLTNSEPSIVTRRRLKADAKFAVSRLSDGRQVLARDYLRTASYTTDGDRFAADLSLQTAQRKLATFIAEQFAIELIAAYDQL